jgi:hypothetical protein
MVNQLESFIMSKDEFRDFLKILNYYSDMCDDLHIVDRKVLQRVDSQVAIIRCDLSNLLQLDGEVIFCNISTMVKNLKGLAKNSPIRFRRLENSLLIKDTTTSISISLGHENYCNNKKISEAEFNEIFIQGPMFLECEIDKNLCDLLSKFSKLNNKHSISLSIRSGNAFLGYGEVGDIGIRSEFKLNCNLKEDMFNCKMNLSAMIFNIKSAATLRIYFDEKNGQNDTMSICILNFFINENNSLEIYCRLNIIREPEEE